MTCAGTSSCDGDVDASLPYFDREIRVIGLLIKEEDDGLVVVVRGEVEERVTVDCEKLDWWLMVVNDDMDLLLKSREEDEEDNLKLLRSEPPEIDLLFSFSRRLKTLTLIHTQIFLYGFNASSPKPKKAKKMILEAGIVHQLIIRFVIDRLGKSEVENEPTREKSLWTFSQLIHGRRPMMETFEKMLKAVTDVPNIISIRAIEMRRI